MAPSCSQNSDQPRTRTSAAGAGPSCGAEPQSPGLPAHGHAQAYTAQSSRSRHLSLTLLGLLIGLSSVRRASGIDITPFLITDPNDIFRALKPKIYVYKDKDNPDVLRPLFSSKNLPWCKNSQWGTERRVHLAVMNSTFVTKNANEANIFYIPAFFKCDSWSMSQERLRRQEMLLAQAMAESPYFLRSGGRDHVILFPSGKGPALLNYWERFLSETVFLMTEPHFTTSGANRAPYFNPFKDLVIPGYIREPKLPHLINSRVNSTKLACFTGAVQDVKARVDLLLLASQYTSKTISVITTRTMTYEDYVATLNCKFCLIPRGLSAWTLRFFEAMLGSCIPVLLNDFTVLPFETLIDYSKFLIKWPVEDISEGLIHHLSSIPNDVYEEMQREKRRVRCLMAWHPTGDTIGDLPCTALVGTMFEITRRIPRSFKHSPLVFWDETRALKFRDKTQNSALQPLLGTDLRHKHEAKDIMDVFIRKPVVCANCTRSEAPVACNQKDSRFYCYRDLNFNYKKTALSSRPKIYGGR